MSLLFAAAAARTRITATMRSLTALSSSQAAQAAALTTTTATTPSVRMPAAFPSRSAFKRLDSHLKRSKAMFRHHPTSFSSHRAVSAAAAGAEAMASSSSAAAAGGGDIDFVGSQLPQEEDEEEELPESFKEFDLDDRVTVSSVEERKRKRKSASGSARSCSVVVAIVLAALSLSLSPPSLLFKKKKNRPASLPWASMPPHRSRHAPSTSSSTTGTSPCEPPRDPAKL